MLPPRSAPLPPPPSDLSSSDGGDQRTRAFTAQWPFPTIISTLFAVLVILKIILDVLWLRHLERARRRQEQEDIEQGRRPRDAAAPERRKSLKTTLKQYESRGEGRGEEVCAICLEEMEEGEWCRVLDKCNHMYHRDCIDEWFSKDNHCPLCRDSVHGGSNRSAPTNIP